MKGRRLSLIVLCAALIGAAVVFGVPNAYTLATYCMIAVVLLTMICVAAWSVGARAVVAAAEENRWVAVSGVLLIAPLTLFSLLAGIGPPGGQSDSDNELRYVVLFIGAFAVGAGFIVLTEALRAAHERLYSTLGYAAISCATPLYLIWATILIGHFREQIAHPGETVPWVVSLLDLSDVVLFFAGALTYAATAAFAMSLGRIHWIGRGAAAGFAIASFVALLCLAVRGLGFPDPARVFAHWYSIPGYVVGIPAVPWMIPCVLGIMLLHRAGLDETV